MMKRMPFLKNRYAVSAMYDAVLFIVMVSLSGVVLLPALHSDIAIESSVETHQEAVVDEALNTFLVSRVDKFSYKVGGDILAVLQRHRQAGLRAMRRRSRSTTSSNAAA